MYNFKVATADDDLQPALDLIQTDHPDRFGSGKSTITLHFNADPDGSEGRLATEHDAGEVTVRYHDRSTALRALGRLLAAEDESDLTFTETAAFSMRGLMIDCSRNGVLRLDAARTFMQRVALMGVNMLMLYTEDTYQVPDEPFFGYLRGAYSPEEIRALDDHAHTLGIELIPCIQTLGHLEQILQWPAMAEYRDTGSILLADDENTLAFIEKLVITAAGNVRSNRIHLGMDEAVGLGPGRFKEKFGEQSPFEIINRHLRRLCDICREQDLEPMIWSDMYFRLGSRTHDYHDPDWQIPEEVVDEIPTDVQLVYWDYYHEESDYYRQMIERHRGLGHEPVMAGGIWTWSHLWCALPWSFTAVDACMTGAREENLNEAFMTMWGDMGMEVDIFSALPGIQYFCEHAFDADDPMAAARRHFAAVCDGPMEPWVRAADIDSIPLIDQPDLNRTAVSRHLLWQDPALALLDPMLDETDLTDWYRKVADDLRAAIPDEPDDTLAGRLAYPAAIAEVLELKVHLRRDLHEAVTAGDRDRARTLADERLAELRRRVDTLWQIHRDMWMKTYRPFGWEVIESRYGTLRARLETLQQRLIAFADGELDDIPELSARLHNPWPEQTLADGNYPNARLRTPSRIN
ncbi:MAG: beta-N-acetylhexosaminidase [Phycisphaeraceae bacterium]|nr:beta-N-acetylhexosaminidase [Phycisphaeraceae bacterium]